MMSTGARSPDGIAPERDFRRDGCDERCRVEQIIISGTFGRLERLLHDPLAHEEHGRRLGALYGWDGVRPVRTGPLVVDVPRAAVTLGGAPLALAPNELRVLLVLAAHPGVVVPYREIAGSVWGEPSLALPQATWMHMLRSTICRLRRRMRPAGGLVQPLMGVGLRLVMVAADGEIPAVPDHRASRLVDRWARNWERCSCCGRSDLPHNGRGLCTGCHGRECRGTHHRKELRA